MLYLPRSLTSSEQWQGLVEYALLLAMVTLAVIVLLAMIGPAIGNIFSNIVRGINNYVPQTGGGGWLFPF